MAKQSIWTSILAVLTILCGAQAPGWSYHPVIANKNTLMLSNVWSSQETDSPTMWQLLKLIKFENFNALMSGFPDFWYLITYLESAQWNASEKLQSQTNKRKIKRGLLLSIFDGSSHTKGKMRRAGWVDDAQLPKSRSFNSHIKFERCHEFPCWMVGVRICTTGVEEC